MGDMIVLVGDVALDHIMHLDRLPATGEDVPSLSSLRCPGGRSSNAAVAAAMLGADVRLAACLASDDAGERLRSALADCPGVYCAWQPAMRTASAVVLVDGEGERTIVYSAAEPQPRPRLANMTAEFFHGATCSFHDESDRELRAVFLGRARGHRGTRLRYLLADKEVQSGWDFTVDSHTDLPEELAEDQLRELGLAVCVVTEAEQGGRWWTPAHGWRRWKADPPPPARPLADRCGSGDVFLGALLAALDRGLSWERALRVGARAGAVSVAYPGGWSGRWPLGGLALELAGHQPPLRASGAAIQQRAVRYVVMDLDDTLIRHHDLVHAWRTVSTHYQFTYEEEFPDPGGRPLFELLRSCGLRGEDVDDAERLFSATLLAGPLELLPGTRELLGQLREDLGQRLLLSSGLPQQAVQEALERTGLTDAFELALGSEADCSKGEAHFARFVEHLGVAENDFNRHGLVVGDSPADMRLAARQGVASRIALVPRGSEPALHAALRTAGAQLVISHIGELPVICAA